MNFIQRFFNAIKWGSSPPRDPVIASWFNAWNNNANVTPDSAMRVATVYACVKVISESVAMLPLNIYSQKEDGSKKLDFTSTTAQVLKKPNQYQTTFDFWQMAVAHLLLRGNFYALKQATGLVGISGLKPLHPDRMAVYWNDEHEKRIYKYKPLNGPEVVYIADEIFHITGMSFDGLTGVSPIEYQRETIGQAMNMGDYGNRLFENGTHLGGILKHPSKITKEAADRLLESWEKQYKGAYKAGKTALLEEGMTFEKLGMTSEDAQFLETRKFNRSEIAAIFGVPPHKIGDLEHATFSNIEHQALEFVTNSLTPILTRIEKTIERDLLYKPNQYAKFKVQALLRGDSKSRNESYAIGRQWGWLSANDVRRMEDMDPIENGDVYLSPMNMTPAEQLGKEPTANEPQQVV